MDKIVKPPPELAEAAFKNLNQKQKLRYFQFFDRVEDRANEVIEKFEDVLAYMLIENGNPMKKAQLLHEAKEKFEEFKVFCETEEVWISREGIPYVLAGTVVHHAIIRILRQLHRRTKKEGLL